MMGQCISARLSGSHQIASVCLCVCAAFGVSLWSNEGDNGVKQPSLNYNCVVSLDADWNVGLGEKHHIHLCGLNSLHALKRAQVITLKSPDSD